MVLHTTLGDILIELWRRECPKAVRNFVQLCLEGKPTRFTRTMSPSPLTLGSCPQATTTAPRSTASSPASSPRPADQTSASTMKAALESRPTRYVHPEVSVLLRALTMGPSRAASQVQPPRARRHGRRSPDQDQHVPVRPEAIISSTEARNLTPEDAPQVLLHARRRPRTAEQAHPLRPRHRRLALQPPQVLRNRTRTRLL